MLSFDEWNVWYHTDNEPVHVEPWTVGPPLWEDLYTFEDALVVGCCLITLMRHADQVRIACMAQLVNALASIRTENGGPAWRQTTFYPFLHASRYGRGEVLHTIVRSPLYSNARHGDVPFLDAVATVDRRAASLTLFCVNRSLDERIELTGRLGRFPGCGLVEHITLTHPDRHAANTRDHPDTVVPRVVDATRVDGEAFQSLLPPYPGT